MVHGSLMHWLRTTPVVTRPVAGVVVLALLSLLAMPTVVAARQAEEHQPVAESAEPAALQRLQHTVDAIRNQLATLEHEWSRAGGAGEATVVAALERLAALRGRLLERHAEMLIRYRRLSERLARGRATGTVHERQQRALLDYVNRLSDALDQLKVLVDSEPATPRLDVVRAARANLRPAEPETAHRFDPNNLPSKAIQRDEPVPPRTTPEQFRKDGLSSRPRPRLASHGTFELDELAGAADPRWRAATTEVTLTESIEAKAEELEHDPVAIHQWVRNNVVWIPSWGATQDAAHTLSSQRGNAMDIAGLEIALLRASGIPARYAHGTIEVDAERFSNWAGGFDRVSAAADYAASGGIPITSLQSGGRTQAIRMEHVWVEAAVDYFPSRGAVNRSADSWIALDPSYKQYDFSSAVDAADTAGVDPQGVAQRFSDSGTTDETAGFVQDLDQSILREAMQRGQTELTTFVEEQEANGASFRDVLGGRSIRAESYETLPASIPNRLVTTGARYDALPAALQHRIALGFSTDFSGRLNVAAEFAWARVNGARLELTFSAATQTDRDALVSLLPEGDEVRLSDIPESIPSHLVDVVPEIRLDGEVIATGSAVPLGQELDFGFRVEQVGFGADTQVSPVAAGSHLGVAVAGGSVSPARVERVQSRLTDTHDRLVSPDDALAADLTRNELIGDLFHAGALSYFGQLDTYARFRAHAAGGQVQLAPSAGTYGYRPTVSTLFGMPQSISGGTVSMDLDRVARVLGGVGDADARRAVNLQVGALSSALEHAVPEQQFVLPGETREGISAVKALRLAGQQGQRIYEIDASNRAEVLPQLNLSGTAERDIRSALDAGKQVVAHTDPVSVEGYSGAGYAVLDPATGNGAWRITGGTNGGSLDALQDAIYVGVSAILGYLNGSFGQYAGKRYIFSDTLKYFSKIGRIASVLGYVGLAAVVFSVLMDDNLSGWEKAGSIAISLLAFGLSYAITTGVIALFGSGILAALLLAVIGVLLTVVLIMIKDALFGGRRVQYRYA